MSLAGPLRGLATAMIVAALAASGGTAAVAEQDMIITIRSGDHPGFGRVAIDTNSQAAYRLDQVGDRVLIRFLSPVVLGKPPSAPQNVAAIRIFDQTIELTIRNGSTIRSGRIGDRFFIDILAPGEAPPIRQAQMDRDRASAKRPAEQPSRISSLVTSPELGGRRGKQTTSVQPASGDKPAAPSAAATASSAADKSPSAAAKPPSSGPVGGTPAGRTPVQTPPSAPPPPQPAILEVSRQPAPATEPLPAAEASNGLLARRIKLPGNINGSAFLLPFSPSTGAAAFREGDVTYLVFDERRPVDLSGLKSDPVFAQAFAQSLATGTLVGLPHPSSLSVALAQTPPGWQVGVLSVPAKPQPIPAVYASGRMNFLAEQADSVVSMIDPVTGAILLVGTQRRPGQAVTTVRRTTEFITRRTLQGVVIEPLSDAMTLKTVPNGFSLANGSDSLALSEPTSATEGMAETGNLTRRLHFSAMRPEALRQHLTEQTFETAMTPVMARGPKRRAAAESMMSLGLEAEAEGLLRIAAEQDPREAASPDTAALTAIAALLAGRPNEADALNDPGLTGTDEIALWRAVRQAMLDPGSPEAAAVFASTAPLALVYPPAVRDRILPLILETMLQGGEIASAARLLDQRPDDPRLAYARALRVQAEGDIDRALGMLDALADGHDQFDRARAALRAVELRLAAHKIDTAKAADALDKLLYAWRGDGWELALRERIADLRSQSGGWREGLATLRQAETDFPDQAAAVHQRLKDMFAGMIQDPSPRKMQALDFVSMLDENADLMADPQDQEALAEPLADRLLALDLPGRAKPLLEKLLHSAKTDAARARLGASLAALELQEKDDAGALAKLDASEAADLPADLAEQRAVLRATAMARLRDLGGGAAILADLKTPKATAARAQILEDAKDWAAAAQAWSAYVGLTVPEAGALDDVATRTLLRLATATARADDEPGLAALRQKYGNRVGAGSLGDMFRLLTAEPIRTVSDIGRSKQEVNLAGSLATDLKALQAGKLTR